MTTTVGKLVSDLFARYERELRDPELAAVATQVRLAELLERATRERRPRDRRAA
jgi:hypothetical protein